MHVYIHVYIHTTYTFEAEHKRARQTHTFKKAYIHTHIHAHDIQVQSLCNRLPAIDTKEFNAELIGQQRDALLVVYLAIMTKGTHTANELIDKVCLAHTFE